MMTQTKIGTFMFFICLVLVLIPLKVAGSQKDPLVYKVGPGDIITLTVIAGGVEQAKADLLVSGQGEVSIPFVGNIKVSGLTLKDLEKKIYIPLEKDYFVS